jgi:hypothetical protein
MPDDFEMDRFEWFLVLQAFYEENLGFEYTGGPEYVHSFKPDRPELEGIDFASTVADLNKAGLLEVTEESYYNESIEDTDTLSVISLSEKGYEVIFEHHSREAQRKYNEEIMEHQREFDERQTTRQNEVNAAIGYLTLGLLVVTCLDLVVSSFDALSQFTEYIPHITVVGITATIGIGYFIYSLGLLDPEG